MTSTNDEREALRDFADRMQEAAANCCIDPDAGPDAQTSISFTGEEGAKLAHALHSVLASLPAPAPAAGEAVAYASPGQMASMGDPIGEDAGAYIPLRKTPAGKFTMPLYASPQAPATGGRWQHKKRGTVYEVIGEAELQCATHDPSEGDELVIYRGDDGKLWARMRDEFHDGRFEALRPDLRGEG